MERVPLIDYKGTCILDRCEIEDIQSMTIRDDDTWVISFPRSGTTLTQELVYNIRTDFDFETSKAVALEDRFPFLDACWDVKATLRGLKYIEDLPSPRFIKSHLHYHVLPKTLFKSNCKKLYVFRNTKDVCVSNLMFARNYLRNTDISMETYFNLWLHDQVHASPWWLHVRDFWLRRHDPNILVLQYENLVKDMPGSVRTIADHLGVAVTDDQVSQLVDHCSFSSMQNNTMINAAHWGNRAGGFIRKGKVGGWKEHLTEEMSAQIDSMVQDKLGDLDINFDYGEMALDKKILLKEYKGTRLYKQCEIEEIQAMTVQDDDTWVISYPRSGTTLTQEIVYLLKTNLAFESARKLVLDDRFPFLDMYLEDGPHCQGLNYIEKYPSPRFIKSHMHYHTLPKTLFDSPCKKVYVFRNPKDVCVSNLMFARTCILSNELSMESYFNLWLLDQVHASPWWLHVRDFWLQRHDPNILVLQYENLVKDMSGTIRTIADFLGVTVSDDQVSQLVDHCGFRNMQNNPTVNPDYWSKIAGGFIRKGKVGGWKEHLTEEMSAQIDSMVKDKLGDLDINFDYHGEMEH